MMREKPPRGDRKSTRLNSSHQIISYAVFCLKKKKNQEPEHSPGSFTVIRALSHSARPLSPLAYSCVAVQSVFSLPFIVFFFNDTATTEIYTLSLHDALPI